MPKPGAPHEENRQPAARLLLYAVEMTGDPGAAEHLVADAAGRPLHPRRPSTDSSRHLAMLTALTLLGQRALARCPRQAIPAQLLPPDDLCDRDMEAAVAELPGRERAALLLVLIEKLDYETIATVLRTTPANAGRLVYRARTFLRARLVGPGPAEPESSAGTGSGNHRLSRILDEDCRGAVPFISALLDAQLNEKQLTLMGNHLSICAACREERDRLQQVSAAVINHWNQLLGQLVAGGWSNRAAKLTQQAASPAHRNVTASRARRLMITICAITVVVATLLWAGPDWSGQPAVTGTSGPVVREEDTWSASADSTLDLFDGSRIHLHQGAAVRVERRDNASRPRVWMLGGQARLEVSAGPEDLAVESAAGRASASAGSFSVRLLARDAMGSRMEMRFLSSASLARGERLTLLLDSSSDRLIAIGRAGQEIPVPPGALALLPCGERPAILALPGRWHELPRWGGLPPARRGAAMTLDHTEGLAAVFGGTQGNGQKLAELWGVDLLLGGWFEASDRPGASEAALPPAQTPCGLLADPSGSGLWLYSGQTASGISTEIWHRRGGIVNGSWHLVQVAPPPIEPRGTSPAGRAGAALATSPVAGGIVLFGGSSGGRAQCDTWLLDTAKTTWRRIALQGRTPEARTGAALAACGNGRHLYLFGGRGATGTALDDTWRLDFTAEGEASWQLLNPARRPAARWGACLTAVASDRADRLVLFGGRPRLGGPLSDTWVLSGNTDSCNWERMASLHAPTGIEQDSPPMVWLDEQRILALWSGTSLWTLRLDP
jgi:hypothetical protein